MYEIILDDAHRVAAYAARAGIDIGQDLRVIEARIRANIKRSIEVAPEDFARLEQLMSDAVRKISPITLRDLRNNKDSFYQAPPGMSRYFPVRSVLFLFSIAIILTIIFLTDNVTQKRAAIAAINEAASSVLEEKFHDVSKKILSGRLLGADKDELATLDKDVSEISRLAELRFFALYLTGKIDEEITFPKFFQSLMSASSNEGRDARGVQIKKKSPSVSEFFKEDSGISIAVDKGPSTLATTRKGPCDFKFFEKVNADDNPKWIEPITRYKAESECVSSVLDIYIAPFKVQRFKAEATKSILVTTSWVLPTLFGVLGAIVFLMRHEADVKTPRLSVSDIIFRAALGAIAGLSVGWFWIQPTNNVLLHASDFEFSISATPFLIAFIIGFSVDIGFSILDSMANKIRGDVR